MVRDLAVKLRYMGRPLNSKNKKTKPDKVYGIGTMYLPQQDIDALGGVTAAREYVMGELRKKITKNKKTK